jgi:hypothetical protein
MRNGPTQPLAYEHESRAEEGLDRHHGTSLAAEWCAARHVHRAACGTMDVQWFHGQATRCPCWTAVPDWSWVTKARVTGTWARLSASGSMVYSWRMGDRFACDPGWLTSAQSHGQDRGLKKLGKISAENPTRPRDTIPQDDMARAGPCRAVRRHEAVLRYGDDVLATLGGGSTSVSGSAMTIVSGHPGWSCDPRPNTVGERKSDARSRHTLDPARGPFR